MIQFVASRTITGPTINYDALHLRAVRSFFGEREREMTTKVNYSVAIGSLSVPLSSFIDFIPEKTFNNLEYSECFFASFFLKT